MWRFSIKGFFGSNEPIDDVAEEQADINIFTVASGLLYEVRTHCTASPTW